MNQLVPVSAINPLTMEAHNSMLQRNLKIFRDTIFITDCALTRDPQGHLIYKDPPNTRDFFGYIASFSKRTCADPAKIKATQIEITQFIEEQKKIFTDSLQHTLNTPEADKNFISQNLELLEKIVEVAREKFSQAHTNLPVREIVFPIQAALDSLEYLNKDPRTKLIAECVASGVNPLENSLGAAYLDQLKNFYDKLSILVAPNVRKDLKLRIDELPVALSDNLIFKRLQRLIRASEINCEVENLLSNREEYPSLENSPPRMYSLLNQIGEYVADTRTNPMVLNSDANMKRLRAATLAISKIEEFPKLFRNTWKTFNRFYAHVSVSISHLPVNVIQEIVGHFTKTHEVLFLSEITANPQHKQLLLNLHFTRIKNLSDQIRYLFNSCREVLKHANLHLREVIEVAQSVQTYMNFANPKGQKSQALENMTSHLDNILVLAKLIEKIDISDSFSYVAIESYQEAILRSYQEFVKAVEKTR